MSVEVIKADVLALPGLSTALGTVNEMAWVATLAYVNEYDMGAFGGESDDAVLYARMLLAAHLMLSTKRAFTGVAGPVTSRSVGQVRQSFGLLAQAAGTNAWVGTIYGQMLIGILGNSAAHGPIVL